MAETDIVKHVISGLCPEFIIDGVRQEITRVIYTRFIITGEDANETGKKRETIISGCSYFQNCENNNCSFSLTGKVRKNKKRNLLSRLFEKLVFWKAR